MRHVPASLASLLLLAAPAAPAASQPTTLPADTSVMQVPRWHLGVAAGVGQPIGDFKRNVKNGAGAQGHVLLRLDGTGLVSLRLQGGWLNYGHESQRSCVGTAPHCRVAVSVTTANGILSLALGPHLSLPLGRVKAYGYGVIGLSRFATLSGLGGGIIPDLVAADENFGDTGLASSGGVGLQLPVNRRTSVDIGVGYESHGRRDYLIKGGLTDQPDGSLGYDVKRSKTNLYAIRIGVTRAMGWGRRRAAPAP